MPDFPDGLNVAFPPSRFRNRPKNSSSRRGSEEAPPLFGVAGAGGIRDPGPAAAGAKGSLRPRSRRLAALGGREALSRALESPRYSGPRKQPRPARRRGFRERPLSGAVERVGRLGRGGGAEPPARDLCPLPRLRGPPGEPRRVGELCQECSPGGARVGSVVQFETGATGRRGFNSSGSGALRGPGGELRLGPRGLQPGRLRTEVPGGEQE